MTKQHYAKIAVVIANNVVAGRTTTDPHEAADYNAGWNDACDQIARQIAAALRGTNPNYDEARFLAVCGVNDES